MDLGIHVSLKVAWLRVLSQQILWIYPPRTSPIQLKTMRQLMFTIEKPVRISVSITVCCMFMLIAFQLGQHIIVYGGPDL
jgi:hypothetical protein